MCGTLKRTVAFAGGCGVADWGAGAVLIGVPEVLSVIAWGRVVSVLACCASAVFTLGVGWGAEVLNIGLSFFVGPRPQPSSSSVCAISMSVSSTSNRLLLLVR